MHDLTNLYLFHWSSARAIWIGGHTLPWDARCSGIYIGIAVAVVVQLLWARAALPPARVLALHALAVVPLVADFVAIWFGFLPPSNDRRYLTGLLFGAGLALTIVPAVASLSRMWTFAGARRRTWGPWPRVLPLVGLAFILKGWDSVVAFAVLVALSMFGFASLLGMLCVGAMRVARGATLKGAAPRAALLLAIVPLLASCAAPMRDTSAPVRPSVPQVCDADTFVPDPAAHRVCRREVCQDGIVLAVEDPAGLAPVDDWAEEKFCLRHPIDCVRALFLKLGIDRWEKSSVPPYTGGGSYNGINDAIRHAHIMCLLTERFGADFARGLGIAHEEDSEYRMFFRKAAPGNPCCEKLMDLYNNEVGIRLASEPGKCEEKVQRSLHLLRHSMCPDPQKAREQWACEGAGRANESSDTSAVCKAP